MEGILLGLGAALCWGASALVLVRPARAVGAWRTLAWAMLVGFAASLPAALVFDGQPSGTGTAWVWAGATSVAFVVGSALWMIGVRYGAVSIVTALVATDGAIGATLAIIGGERPEVLVLCALVVIANGAVLVALGPGDGDVSGRTVAATRRAALLALGSGAIFGGVFFASGRAADLGALWAVAAVRGGGVLLVTLPVLATIGMRAPREILPWLVGGAALDTTGYLCVVAGTANGVAITSVLASQYAVVSVLGGILLYREHIARRQLVGIALTVSGVAALAVVRAL